MDQSPLEWYNSIPIVTRLYGTSIAIVAFLCQFELLSTLNVYYNYRLVFLKGQYWRLLTAFLFFGPINFDFLFHMFFLLRYCRILEEGVFYRRPADFLYLFLFGGICLLILGTIFRIPFLSTALTFMLVYVWSRKNPFVMLNFLGIFNFTAPWMPWVLLSFSFIVSGKVPVTDLIGISVGHTYWYLTSIYPHISNGREILKTPQFLMRLMGQEIPNTPLQETEVEEDGEGQEDQREQYSDIDNDEFKDFQTFDSNTNHED